MLTLLSTETPAELLLPFANALVASETLTEREYRVWYLKHFTPKTMYAIMQTLAAEGYVGRHNKPVSLRTVETDLERARLKIDQAQLAQSEEKEGDIAFTVVVCHGHEARNATDFTPKLADLHLAHTLCAGQRRAA